jgi:hypothetical protein
VAEVVGCSIVRSTVVLQKLRITMYVLHKLYSIPRFHRHVRQWVYCTAPEWVSDSEEGEVMG